MMDVELKESKRHEFVETMKSLIGRFRTASGCMGYRLCMDSEKENLCQLISEWRTQEDYDAYLNSPDFEVLQGGIKVLGESSRTKTLNREQETKQG
jgi:quinol monooxygenase YgiN